jgi:hypothetical protein
MARLHHDRFDEPKISSVNAMHLGGEALRSTVADDDIAIGSVA